MKYKIRKGLEKPCRIHGLYVKDFYFMLCFLAVFVLMVMLDIKSLFEGSTSGITILFEIGLFVLGGIVLYKRLYDKASRNKYKTTGKISTISNRNLLKKV